MSVNDAAPEIEDWPEPEPMQAAMNPEDFARATRLDDTSGPFQTGGGVASSAATPTAIYQQAEEAWPEPELHNVNGPVGDFTRGSINDDTLALIAEHNTLQDSRPEWRQRNLGQWKPAPIAPLGTMVAILCVIVLALLIPIVGGIDTIVGVAKELWTVHNDPAMKNQAPQVVFQTALLFGGIAFLSVFFFLLLIGSHMHAIVGLCRGARSALPRTRVIAAVWTLICVLFILANPGQALSLTGKSTFVWAVLALMIALFSLTWMRSVKQWCRKTLRDIE